MNRTRVWNNPRYARIEWNERLIANLRNGLSKSFGMEMTVSSTRIAENPDEYADTIMLQSVNSTGATTTGFIEFPLSKLDEVITILESFRDA